MTTYVRKFCARIAVMLALALIAMFISVGPLLAADAPSHRRPVFNDPIVGTWNCSIPPAGGAPAFTDIKNIHAGGTQSEIDNAAPPSQESPTVGSWVNTGGRSYAQRAFQMSWDPNENFIGTWHYTGPMSLSPALNQLNIRGTATLVDTDGNVITSFPFTASCTRL